MVAAAIHNGHGVRDEVAELLSLTDAERLREEDPFTAAWTTITEARIVVNTSRFEVVTANSILAAGHNLNPIFVFHNQRRGPCCDFFARLLPFRFAGTRVQSSDKRIALMIPGQHQGITMQRRRRSFTERIASLHLSQVALPASVPIQVVAVNAP